VTKKRKYESFDSKKAAIARKQELEGKAATGEYRPLYRRTWAEFKAEYCEKVLVHSAYKTRCAYSEAIAHFERMCMPTTMAAITTRIIDEFASKRAAEKWSRGKARRNSATKPRAYPVSPTTVNKNLRHLRSVLRRAHRWGYLPIVPEFKLLKTPDREPRALPPDVFERILDAARSLDERIAASEARQRIARRKHRVRGPSHNPPGSDWWTAFLSVAYLAGLRWSEILGLRWGDLRLTRNPTITIRAEISKTARDQRVPMTATLADRLRRWMSRCSNVADDALVFPHSCHQRTISVTWERLQTWAQVADPYRFHDLRVSFCTNLVASGTEAATLMKLARHKSLATTIKFYRGRTEEADRRALERMEAAFTKSDDAQAPTLAREPSGEQSGEHVLHS
jgi:integrase